MAAVTPSDTVKLQYNGENARCKALFIGGAGNVSVVDENGLVTTFTGVLAGTTLPVAVDQVNATLTTATNIVAYF